MTDDAELLRRFAEEQSEQAFTEFVQRHFGLVYGAALRRTNGDEHRAVEVAQQVFTTAARRAAALARHHALTGWLYTATRNAALNLLRDEHRRSTRDREAGAMNVPEAAPAPEADWSQLRPVIDDVMDELNGPDREAVLLRFFEGRAFAEVGTRLHVTENAARMRVDRALGKLRARLARRGITSTSAALGTALMTQASVAAPAGMTASVTTLALKGAAMGGANMAAGIFLFMNTAKISTGVTGVLAVIAIGFGVNQYRRSCAMEEALATMTHERDGLNEQVRGLEKAQLEAKKNASMVSAPAANTADRAKTSGAVPTTTGDETAAAAEAALDKLVAGSPELQRLYVQQKTIRLRSQYGPFYRSAGLTPAQIEQFEKVMSAYAQASIDVPAVALAQGLQKNDPAVATLLQQALDQKAQDLHAALGGAKYDELEQYERTMRMREVATSLASELYYTDTPLTADQADQLTQIVDASRGSQKGVVNWGFIVAQAQAKAVLSPSQLAVLAEKKTQFDLGARIYVLTQSSRTQPRAAEPKGADPAPASPGR